MAQMTEIIRELRRRQVLRAMQGRAGRLVTFRELRSVIIADKQFFDAAVIDLARAGRIALDEHDFPGSLTDDARSVLVHHDGLYYVGCSFRR